MFSFLFFSFLLFAFFNAGIVKKKNSGRSPTGIGVWTPSTYLTTLTLHPTCQKHYCLWNLYLGNFIYAYDFSPGPLSSKGRRLSGNRGPSDILCQLGLKSQR